ncbi:MAG: serine protease [Pyrinomonadaceae bacterium]|nr:serine protease [Pyrinomonadaceae bacterium]
MIPFEYLTFEEQNNVIDAFMETDIEYDATTRKLLMRGLNRTFVSNHLRIVGSDPNRQLASDLMTLNRVERLIDGSIPLKQWLNNALRLFDPFTQINIIQEALTKIEQVCRTPEVILRDADIPRFEIEEIITGETDEFQEVAFLSKGAERVAGVAKILVPRFEKGERRLTNEGTHFISSGTGWLISNNYLITNYHVIENRAEWEDNISEEDLQKQVVNSEAQFFFDSEDLQGKHIRVCELIAFNKDSDKDFAILKLSETLEDVMLLPVLNQEIVLPKTCQLNKRKAVKPLAVNIIQHPGGGPKRIALRNNLVYSAEYPLLHYYTDTLGGSSGSPVFNDSWQVIGLHRAAIPKQTEFNGRKLGYINQGIQIHSILASLNKLAQTDEKIAEVWKQIKSSQSI